MDIASLPGVGQIEGRAPTIEEYEIAQAEAQGSIYQEAVLDGRGARLGTAPTSLANRLARVIRMRRQSQANQGEQIGRQDGDQLDRSDMEPNSRLLAHERGVSPLLR